MEAMTRIADVAREAVEHDGSRTPGDWRAVKGRQAASVVAKDCAVYINVDSVVIDDTVKRWQADAAFIAFSANNLRVLAETVLAWAPVIEAAKEWAAAAPGSPKWAAKSWRLREALSTLSKEPTDDAG